MNQIKSIFKNTSWMTLSQVITSVCAFLWTILIARYLGVSDYGIVSFAISFTGLLGIIMDLGMSTYVTREIAKNIKMIHLMNYESSQQYRIAHAGGFKNL